MKLIPLTKGQVALVDDEDYEYLSQWKWYADYNPKTKSFYATRHSPRHGGGRHTIRIHRIILNAQKGEQVDHESHDTLDNRRANLRLTNSQGNNSNASRRMDNTSGHCGVHWHKRKKRWCAHIRINSKRIHLGSYTEKSDAIAARQAANIQYGFHPNHGKVFA